MTTDVLARPLGAGGAYALLSFGVIVVVVLAALGFVAWRINGRARRAAERKREQEAADRLVRWTWFSRPNLDDGGRTWLVGVERRTEDDRVLRQVLVTDEPIPRDHALERTEAESRAIAWAEEYNLSGAR